MNNILTWRLGLKWRSQLSSLESSNLRKFGLRCSCYVRPATQYIGGQTDIPLMKPRVYYTNPFTSISITRPLEEIR